MTRIGRERSLRPAAVLLPVYFVAAVAVAAGYFLLLTIAYLALGWWYPDLLGPIAESPLKWALWVALARVGVETLVRLPHVIETIKRSGKDYRAGDFFAARFRVGRAHGKPPDGRARVVAYSRNVLLAVITTIVVLVYFGGFQVRGDAVLIAAISVLVMQLPDILILGILVIGRKPVQEPTFDASAEFARQVDNLHRLRYPHHAGLTTDEFNRLIEPLKDVVIGPNSQLPQPLNPERTPFLIVIRQHIVSADTAIRLVKRQHKNGRSAIDPEELARLEPLPTIVTPAAAAYLLLDIDIARETRNRSANEALTQITARGRTPLTVEEGIALVIQYPDVLDNVALLLPGSPRGGSMVPVLWVRKEAPKLSWLQAERSFPALGCPACGQRRGSPTSVDETSAL